MRVDLSAAAHTTRQTFAKLLTRESLTSTTAVLIYLALVDFVAHLLVANNYGYFRDELYYMADGRHLAFGYVDQAPLIGWLAALVHATLGDSLVAIHLIPALASAGLIVVASFIARELGGGRLAQFLAALATMFSIVFMATGSIFSMDVLDELLWALGALLVIRIIRRQEPWLWLLFGVVAGLGILNKLSMLFFGLALVIALLLTPARAFFRGPEIWLGGAIALLLALPYIGWEFANGWPSWEFWRHYGGLSGSGPIAFPLTQILDANPVMLPLWIAGLYFFLVAPAGKPYRALGWTYVVLYLIFTLINAKAYFLSPAYPMLYGAGGVVFEHAVRQGRWRWVQPIYLPALVLAGLFFAPLAMPILPPAVFVNSPYAALAGTGNAGAGQRTAGKFPQYLGDRFGWDTMTATVARVYDALPADERAQACIFTDNYGEAGALSLLGPRAHLPPVISGHNNYYLWGPGGCSGRVLITVGMTKSDLAKTYGRVAQAATITCDYCMAEEDELPVYVATQPTRALDDAWRSVKHFG